MPEALGILDMLEGYAGPGRRNHYERRLVRVTTARGTPLAWVYVAGAGAITLRPSQVLSSGDWFEVAYRLVRRWLLAVPGRVLHSGRQVVLRLVQSMLWAATFIAAYQRLRLLTSSA